MLKRLIHFIALLLLTSGAYAQAQRLVLFEEFTGENCNPCAGTNPYVNALVNAYPNDVVWIRYQSPIPTAGLIYYQNTVDDNTRMNYYGVNSAPWGQQDGAMWDSSLVSNWGNLPITWCADTLTGNMNPAYLTAEYGVPSPFSIAVTYHLNAAADSFYATVQLTGAESYKVSQAGQLKLRVAMLENLSFATPPGTNGETQFPDVVRKMYPSAAGTALPDSSYSGLVQTFNFSGLVPAYIYDKTQIRFAAFIQDDHNQHVQQAGVSTYYTLPVDAKALAIQGNFVVCDTPYSPSFNFTNNGTQTLTSAVINLKLDATSLSSINWTGSLAPGASTSVTLAGLNPTVGAHNLSAIVTNPNGGTDVNPGNDTARLPFAITTAPGLLPLIEGFENASSPGWSVQSLALSPYTWARQNIGDNSSYSYEMDFWDEAFGDVDNLYAPTLDLSGIANPKMKFSRADAQYDFGAGNGGLSTDSLYINASTDCGATWTTVYANGGTTLATVAAAGNAYSPASTDWVNDTVDLSVVGNNPSVILQFNAVSGNGNNLYIDNINIYNPAAVGIKPVSSINAVSIFPNPTSNLLNVNVQLAQSAEVSFEVTNTLGQVVLSGPAEIQNAGNNSFTINTAKMQSGVYFLSFITGAERTSKMFAVIH